MGILLYIIATILWMVLTPINWIIVCLKHGISNNYFLETAIDIDKFGNRNFRAFLNFSMVKSLRKYRDIDRFYFVEPYKFGNVNETISSVLGKNQRLGTLSNFGKITCKTLDFLDKNHCKNSINDLIN